MCLRFLCVIWGNHVLKFHPVDLNWSKDCDDNEGSHNQQNHQHVHSQHEYPETGMLQCESCITNLDYRLWESVQFKIKIYIIIKKRELSKMIILNSITAAVSCFNYLRCEISYKKSCKHCSTRASGDVRDQ